MGKFFVVVFFLVNDNGVCRFVVEASFAIGSGDVDCLNSVFSGGSPYPRMDGKRIASLLQQEYRMPKPQPVNDKL